jgi:hypothetical protein
MTEEEIRAWLAIRIEAAKHIDANTAEVTFFYTRSGDPYDIYPPAEQYNVGRSYFARAPGSSIWVWLGDLPKVVSDALWAKHSHKLAFPAGLPLRQAGEIL